MPLSFRSASALPAALALLASALPGANAQVTNGSFEAGTFTGNVSASYTRLPVGSTNITGWTVTNGQVLWGQNGNSDGIVTPFGSRFLDLADAPPTGGITQTIGTTAGQAYSLSFALGINSAFGSSISVVASAGGASQTFAFSPAGGGNQWQQFSLPFVAAGATTPITFVASTGGNFVGLDNVSVTAAAPEPGSVALLGVGLAGMVAPAIARRRSARRAK